MFCPKCGFDMEDNKICEKCGFNSETVETQNEELEDIKVDFDENASAEVETETEDEVVAKEEDLVIDFDEIQENQPIKPANSGSWLVSLVSFIAGVLATLVVIGCVNGTVMSCFDKVVNGNPSDTVTSFLKTNFETADTDVFTDISSIYYRSYIASTLESYAEQGYSVDVDTDIDVTDDKAFKEVAKFWLTGNSSYTIKVDDVIINSVDYYKSSSDEYNTNIEKYKSSTDEKVADAAKNATVFAKVSFSLDYSIVPIEQTTAEETTTAASTEKTKKNNKTTTTTTTTTAAATTTTTTKGTEQGSIICVKEDGNWKIFSDIEFE